MSSPLASIVLPTYNRGALLLDAVASVRAQTCGDWELLISDDGSTDGSLEALPEDPRLRVIRLTHTGNVARVRQAALDVAQGVFVGFLDSDDRWLPEKLGLQIERCAARPDAGWCFGDYRLVNEDGNAIPLRMGIPATSREGPLFDLFITDEAGIALQTILVRRELAIAIGFDPRVPLCEDLDFMVRLAHRADACRVPALIAEFLDHPQRATRRRYDQRWHLARAFWRYQRLTTDPVLRRACRRRAARFAREYLASVRAAAIDRIPGLHL
jgi:glycosyltransferase involved in cell wall biosynthesis